MFGRSAQKSGCTDLLLPVPFFNLWSVLPLNNLSLVKGSLLRGTPPHFTRRRFPVPSNLTGKKRSRGKKRKELRIYLSKAPLEWMEAFLGSREAVGSWRF